MSQHDFDISTLDANTGVTMRAAINAALQALASNNAGETEPATPYAYMWWPDTTNDLLKIRNAANSGWITICKLSTGIIYATAAQIIAGTAGLAIAPDQLNLAGIVPANIYNLKLEVNTAVNKLDVFTRTGGAAPDATHVIRVDIPDGNGNVHRSLITATQGILADATAYWGAVSGADKLKIHVYFIWSVADGAIKVALSRYAGFKKVPTTATAGDDDYFLVIGSYTKVATDFCVAVGYVWANYNTANTPDWTIYQTSDDPELAPQVIWNPKSDYGYSKNLTTTISSESDIIASSIVNLVVKQSGKYWISAHGSAGGAQSSVWISIKTGNASWGSAIQRTFQQGSASFWGSLCTQVVVYLNAGDTIHLGISVSCASGMRYVDGDSGDVGATVLSFKKN